jgi:general secretion pathway protein D
LRWPFGMEDNCLRGVGLISKSFLGRALAAGIGVLCLLPIVACGPESVAYKQGRQAELRKDYDQAVIDYSKALQYSPDNSKYLIAQKLARSRAGYFHLNQGERLLAEGRKEEALGEFKRAYSVDPSNETAKQQLTKLAKEQAKERAEREKALQEALKPPEEPATPLGIQLKPLPSEPIAHFHLSAESRKVFEALGKFADLNVIFNYDFQPRQITLDLTNVKLADALQAAAYESHVFWKVVSPNTILIIPDTPTNRREYQDEVLKTVHLSNPLAPQDRTQISTALRQVLGLQRIIDNPSSNSIIIRDTPDKVAAAEQVIHNLDLGKAEVLIDVTIMEANRTRMTTLGIIPATNLALVPNPNVTTSTSTANGTTTSTPGILGLAQTFSSNDYALVLPSATADAMLTDSTTRVLQNPELRATDGLVAKLKIGSRIPYATGSFLPSFGATTGTTGGLGLLSSTQFQYQDIGVNMEITPHITATGEIALHAKVEILTDAGSESIGGLSEPIFGQRSVEHDIQLQEGEVSLLGGLIDRETTVSVTGIPGLGDIPLLKYFFSTQEHDITDDEVLIMLDPHVIRLPEVPSSAASVVSADTAGPNLVPNPGLPQP